MEIVRAYKTSDSQLFETEMEAEQHEHKLKIKSQAKFWADNWFTYTNNRVDLSVTEFEDALVNFALHIEACEC